MSEPIIVVSGEGGYSYEISLLEMERRTWNFLFSFYFFSTINPLHSASPPHDSCQFCLCSPFSTPTLLKSSSTSPIHLNLGLPSFSLSFVVFPVTSLLSLYSNIDSYHKPQPFKSTCFRYGTINGDFNALRISWFAFRVFAKLRKATISSSYLCLSVCLPVCPSVLPSVRMERFVFHLKDFHETWYMSVFRKSVEKKSLFTQIWHEDLCKFR